MAFRYRNSSRLWNRLVYQSSQHKKLRKLNKIKPIARWVIREGDLVEVLVGKDRGAHARVLSVVKERNSVILEGIKQTKRFLKATQEKSGSIELKESLVHVTNVNLVDPETQRKTRVRLQRSEEDGGELLRVSTRSGMIIPWPEVKEEKQEVNAHTDTPSEVALEETYMPQDWTSIHALYADANPDTDETRPARWTEARVKYTHITDFVTLESRFVREPPSQIQVDEGADV